MSIGVFAEKKFPPKESEIVAILGSARERWNELTEWLSVSFAAESELKYMYGQKYGWARRFQHRGALLTALYPSRGAFTVQVILNRASLEQASSLKLSKNAKEALDRAHLYAEGKWLFIPVESERDIEDVKRMVALKRDGKKTRDEKRLGSSASCR